jgi:hypothetical protein
MTFGQSVQYKNCGKYLNLSPCKISHFSKVPKYFSYFYSLLLIYSIEKRFKLEKNHRGPFSLLSTQRCSASGPDLARKQPITVSRAAIADRRSPPVSPLFPQIPLVCSSTWQRRPDCWRRVDHPSPPLYHKDAHVCVCCLEPSRWLRCIVASRHRWPPALPSSSLRRSDSGANRSTTRPRAGCFVTGQLLPCLCMPLGRPVPLLTEASCRPATPVDRCQCRCTATMPRQELGDNASRNASASSFLADTMCGPSSLQLPSHASRGPVSRHPLSSSLPRRRRMHKTPSASSPRKSRVVVCLRPRVHAHAV